MSDTLGFGLFVIGVLIFLGWYAIGTQLNVRKGNDVLRWLQDGLTLVGEKTTMRWLGSSVVELKVQQAKAPFRQVEVFIVLEPRDVPFLWWFFRARGRRDFLIVRSQLHTMPDFELEALDRRAWSTRGVEQAVKSKRWTQVETTPQLSLVAYAEGDEGIQAAPELLNLAAAPGSSLIRLAIRHAVPNLEAQWTLTDIKSLPARRIFETLQHITERLYQPGIKSHRRAEDERISRSARD